MTELFKYSAKKSDKSYERILIIAHTLNYRVEIATITKYQQMQSDLPYEGLTMIAAEAIIIANIDNVDAKDAEAFNKFLGY